MSFLLVSLIYLNWWCILYLIPVCNSHGLLYHLDDECHPRPDALRKQFFKFWGIYFRIPCGVYDPIQASNWASISYKTRYIWIRCQEFHQTEAEVGQTGCKKCLSCNLHSSVSLLSSYFSSSSLVALICFLRQTISIFSYAQHKILSLLFLLHRADLWESLSQFFKA